MPLCINYFKTVLYNCGGKTFHLNLNTVSGIFFLPPIYGIKVLLGCLLSNQSNFICIRIHVLNELLYNFKLCFLCVCLCLPRPERLHRRAHPPNISHKPGCPATRHGVHAVRLHRDRPGNHLDRRIRVSQREGKAEETLAGLLVFLTARCRVGMLPH